MENKTIETEAKKEIAEKMNEILNGKVWAKGDTVRIYLKKGYVSIEKTDESVNIDAVGGHLFTDVKDVLEASGFTTYRA